MASKRTPKTTVKVRRSPYLVDILAPAGSPAIGREPAVATCPPPPSFLPARPR